MYTLLEVSRYLDKTGLSQHYDAIEVWLRMDGFKQTSAACNRSRGWYGVKGKCKRGKKTDDVEGIARNSAKQSIAGRKPKSNSVPKTARAESSPDKRVPTPMPTVPLGQAIGRSTRYLIEHRKKEGADERQIAQIEQQAMALQRLQKNRLEIFSGFESDAITAVMLQYITDKTEKLEPKAAALLKQVDEEIARPTWDQQNLEAKVLASKHRYDVDKGRMLATDALRRYGWDPSRDLPFDYMRTAKSKRSK